MISSEHCEDFQVLPIEACYSIGYREYAKFFAPENLNETLDRLQGSIIAHVWNKFSADILLDTDSETAYVHLARSFCPKVLAASDVF